jgi:flagellar biosynthesis protein FlhG
MGATLAGSLPRCAKAIAFTSGKGGVGKSNIAAATAMLLAQNGQRVLLVDGDLGRANIDVLLGMKPRLTLQHVIRGDRSIEEVLVEGPGGISILPAGSGLQQVASLGETQLEELVSAFHVLDSRMDYFVFDTPAGISFTVTAFLEPSDHVVLVTMPEPTAVTDAYALIKVLWRRGRRDGIGVLVNQASEAEGRSIHRGLAWVSDQFLNQQLEFVGHVPHDPLVGESVKRQQPIVLAYPEAPFVLALRAVVLKWFNGQVPPASGGILAFVQQAASLIGDDGVASQTGARHRT